MQYYYAVSIRYNYMQYTTGLSGYSGFCIEFAWIEWYYGGCIICYAYLHEDGYVYCVIYVSNQ